MKQESPGSGLDEPHANDEHLRALLSREAWLSRSRPVVCNILGPGGPKGGAMIPSAPGASQLLMREILTSTASPQAPQDVCSAVQSAEVLVSIPHWNVRRRWGDAEAPKPKGSGEARANGGWLAIS